MFDKAMITVPYEDFQKMVDELTQLRVDYQNIKSDNKKKIIELRSLNEDLGLAKRMISRLENKLNQINNK